MSEHKGGRIIEGMGCALVAPLALLMLGVGGCSATADNEPIPSRYFRMTGVVEFDGQRIVYDDLIQTYVVPRTISVMGLAKGDNRLMGSRWWIRRLLKDESALIMEVPRAGGLFADMERGGQPSDPNWTPQYIEAYLRPPEEFLPQFRWIDDWRNPMTIESYNSESYFRQPKARLKIVQPIRIEYVPPSPAAEAEARREMHAEPIFPTQPDEVNWRALGAYELSFSALADVPLDIQKEIGALRARHQVMIGEELSGKLHDYIRVTLRFMPFEYGDYGIPQPRRYPDGHGMLYREWSGLTAADAILVRCDERKNCRMYENERGYAAYYRQPDWTSPWNVTVGSQQYQLKLSEGMGLIDYANDRIILFHSIGL